MFWISKFLKFPVTSLDSNKLAKEIFFNSLQSNKIRKYSLITLRINKLKPREKEKAMKFVCDRLAIHEPLIKGLNIGNNQFNPALIEFIRNEIDQGITFFAAPTCRLDILKCLGIIINTQILPWDPEFWRNFSECVKCPNTKNFITLWGFLIKDSNIFSKFDTNRIFNIAHVLVNENNSKTLHPELNAHNISCILVDKSLFIANLRGYPLAGMLCSSINLSKVAEECGMNLLYDIPYCKLLNENLIPTVKTIEPNLNLKIYVKKMSL